MKSNIKNLSIHCLIKVPLKSVFQLAQADKCLGYISEEQSGINKTFTPFTSEGTLPETRCFRCAVETLVQRSAGNPDFLPCDRSAVPRSIIINIIATRAALSIH